MTTQTIGKGVTLTTPKPIEMSLEDFIKGRFKIDISELPKRCAVLVDRLKTYVEVMQPNRIKTVTEVSQQQKVLVDTMLSILNGDTQEAFQCWDILLFLAMKYQSTIFNERTINQHYDKLPTQKQMIFTRLTTLVMGTADVRVRKQFLRKHVIERVLEDLPEEKQRVNLAAFYSGIE